MLPAPFFAPKSGDNHGHKDNDSDIYIHHRTGHRLFVDLYDRGGALAMQTEIEGKFRIGSIDEIRATLQAAGATCVHPMRLMKRALIEESHHEAENSFIRIRDEGDKVTLTYKRREAETLHGQKEIEVIVSDFDKTIELFAAAGWDYTTFQESKRETWTLDGAEVVIDEWPWIDPYIEIEAADEATVRAVAATLGVSWETANLGSVDNFYKEQFPNMVIRGVIDIKEVRFGAPVPAAFMGATT